MNSKFFLDSMATPGGDRSDPTVSNGLEHHPDQKPIAPTRRQHRSGTPKLKPNHRCVSKLDVTLILENSGQQPLLSAQRKIGLVTDGGNNSTYAFFVWFNDSTDNKVETVIPINERFNFQLVPFDPFDPLELSSAGGSDLSLVISYVGDDNAEQPPDCLQTTVEQKPLESKTAQQLMEQILAEYDPLVRATTEKDECREKNQKQYRFLLPYNEQTQQFISQLEHFASESRGLKPGTKDFSWTSQYLSTIDDVVKLNPTKSTTAVAIRSSHSSQDITSKTTSTTTTGFEDNFSDVLKITTATNATTTSGSDQEMFGKTRVMLKKSGSRNLLDLDGVGDSGGGGVQRSATRENSPALSFFVMDRFGSENSLRMDPDHFGTGDDEPSLFADRNREDQIKALTEERESEYVRYEEYSLFVGTWNVNGQFMANPKEFRDHFLAVDPEPPDFYAIGFQELDLSKEAFLFNDNKREDYWIQVCENGLHPKRKYFLLKKVRLIGMMLLIFAAREFEPLIKNVAAEVVGTGILGKIGNKGGVAIRFDLHDTSICFVNCHLAAHVEQFERRNLDFREINSRLVFWQMKPPRRISDHDQIYWFGDLNYRIMFLNSDQVRMMLDAQKYDMLLDHDQLHRQMKERNCFQDYQEGPIRHLPSYKYNPGTNQWDSSEKRRPPAWCDRILWKGANIEQIRYRSHPALKDSDHKPVSAIFRSHVRVVDHRLKRKVYEDVMKKLDKAENDYLPQVSIDTTEIHFGQVSYRQYGCTRKLRLTNTGQSRFKFKFTNKPNDFTYCKPWLRVTPPAGTIKLQETVSIVFELNFDDPGIAAKLNYGLETLSDTLVLRLIGGKDIFVTVTGDYRPSCFGLSLETLVRLERPVGTLTTQEIKQRFGKRYHVFEPHRTSGEPETEDPPAIQIPKELFAVIDYIYRHELCYPYLFQCPGLPVDFPKIRDALDSCCLTDIPGKDQPNAIDDHSWADALLLFLVTLPEPVIPYHFYPKIMRLNRNHQECQQIYRELPATHQFVFQYLMLFLQEMSTVEDSVNEQQYNKLWIATNFGPILVRKPPGNTSNHTGFSLTTTTTYDHYGTLSSNSSSGSSISSPTVPVPTGTYSNAALNLAPDQFFIHYFLNNKSW